MGVPVATIDETGLHLPSFADILDYLKGQYQLIYGADVVLTNDTSDGQWIGIIAAAVNDSNAMAAAVYNAFSPSTAQGTGLSSVVKINGVKRAIASYSTCDVEIIGVSGTVISKGVVGDTSGNHWALPAVVTIPGSGTITVTVTCQVLGAVRAVANTLTNLVTPTRGWQSATNHVSATLGQPVESDPQLRVRQSKSTMIPSNTVLDGIRGAILAVPGVTRCQVYENTENLTNADGIPGHAMSVVVDGGDATAIGEIIAAKKTPGSGTYGTAVITVTNAQGIPLKISFWRAQPVSISWVITVKGLKGFTLDVSQAIRQAMADFTNGLSIGEDVVRGRAFVPANLTGNVSSSTFDLLDVALARDSLPTAGLDIPIAFNEGAVGDPTYVQIVAV